MNTPVFTPSRIREAWNAKGVKQKLAEAVELAEQFPQGEALLELVDKDAGKVQSVLTKLEGAVKEAEKVIDKSRDYLAEADDHATDKS